MVKSRQGILSFLLLSILLTACGGESGSGGGDTVAAPMFNPSSGTYATAQSVTLSTTTPNATIRYSTDGSTPSETVGTVYAGPIAAAASVRIRAVAYLSGWTTSSVSSGAYTITEPKVNVTVGSREVVFDWTVTVLRPGESLLVQLTQNALNIPNKNCGILSSPIRTVVLHLPTPSCIGE